MPPRKTVYITFQVQVNDKNIEALIGVIQDQLRKGVTTIILLIATPGGMVRAGIAAFNFLKGIPAEVHTHNFGQVDSIGVTIYCAGSRRFSSPSARFLIHGIGFNATPNQRFNERLLGERLEGLKNNRIEISNILSRNCAKSTQEIQDMMFQGVVWTADQAVENELVHEIKEELFPRGATVIQIKSQK